MHNLTMLTLTLALAGTAMAAPADPTLSNADRADVVESLGRQLKSQYVFPEVADKVSQALADKLKHGDYASATTAQAFADKLSHDLEVLGNDKHLRVGYEPDFKPEPDEDTAPTAEQLAQWRDESSQRAWGVARTERLPGNIGYLDVRGFGPAEVVAPAFSSAVSLLSGTDAMIIDLRRNGGGDPASVAYLLSHFFATGDTRHLNDIYNRPKNHTREYWTIPSVAVRYTKPVYVLTSSWTFSGGEECAYDFQTQKRATLIGETTGGGANPGDVVALGHGITAFLPTGRAINPITHANWEHVGVKPDVAVPATQAFQRAYADALRTKLPTVKDEDDRAAFAKLLAQVEKGEDVTQFVPPKH